MFMKLVKYVLTSEENMLSMMQFYSYWHDFGQLLSTATWEESTP